MADIEVVIKISSYDKEWITNGYYIPEEINMRISEAIANGIPLDNLLQRLRKRISDLYNTDVTYDNGDYNTMDTPTLDKVLDYFDSEVNT